MAGADDVVRPESLLESPDFRLYFPRGGVVEEALGVDSTQEGNLSPEIPG